MSNKINVAAVSYLNTKPLLFGIEHSVLLDEINLFIDYPSAIAKMLLQGEVDVALVPVAVFPEIKNAKIISDFGIACDGAVNSVCIFSNRPIDEIKNLYLDYQSRTSVALAKWLCEDYWKINPAFHAAYPGYENRLNEEDAALIIGDRALLLKQNFHFAYDLGEAWKKFTGLPFIFAAWVANKTLPQHFIIQFNDAEKKGLQNLHTVIEEQQKLYPAVDVKDYLTNKIKLQFNSEMKKGLQVFLDYLQHKTVILPA
jgi:chorismate dehydratase